MVLDQSETAGVNFLRAKREAFVFISRSMNEDSSVNEFLWCCFINSNLSLILFSLYISEYVLVFIHNFLKHYQLVFIACLSHFLVHHTF